MFVIQVGFCFSRFSKQTAPKEKLLFENEMKKVILNKQRNFYCIEFHHLTDTKRENNSLQNFDSVHSILLSDFK